MDRGRLRRQLRRVVATGSFLAVAAVGVETQAQTSTEPSRWANELGQQEVVLPGYGPVEVSGSEVRLSAGRSYLWKDSLLPVAVAAWGEPLAGPFELWIRVDGQARRLEAQQVRMLAATPHHAEVEAAGRLAGIDVRVLTRVEYDGVAVVTLDLGADQSARIEGLELRVPVRRRPEMQLQGYEPKTIHAYGKTILQSPCGSSAYRNALGFVAGDRGLWWFTDEPPAPLKGNAATTSLRCTERDVELRQPLLTAAANLTTPLRLRFAFLATPVRDEAGDYRRDRVVTGLTPADAEMGNRNLWWVEASAHYALPHTDYPPGAREQIAAGDLAAYPGVARNRQRLAEWRWLGIERLPYMSQAFISPLDPEVAARLAVWRVQPEIATAAHLDKPFSSGFRRPGLSLRAAGLSDYLLWRLDRFAEALDARGFYFDQASPIGSTNPAHRVAGQAGEWSTDILPMRAFYKRLATNLHARGHPPLIYVHNSTTPVIPAYTFVTAMVQGEELIREVKNLDYLASISPDQVRGLYSPTHSGVPTIWLEELWHTRLAGQRPPALRGDQTGWLASADYAVAWRNFMGLAMVHDIPVWTLAPRELYAPIYRQLDRFKVERSRFVGYWEVDPAWRSSALLTSVYLDVKGKRALAIVVNPGAVPAGVDTAALADRLATLAGGVAGLKVIQAGTRPVVVPPRDFALIELR